VFEIKEILVEAIDLINSAGDQSQDSRIAIDALSDAIKRLVG